MALILIDQMKADPPAVRTPIPSPQVTTTASPPPIAIPNTYIIPIQSHSFQTFNNCGPAALSMALSYFGITKSQQELGRALRPYQIPSGDNDDKSTTLEELAKEAEKLGLVPYHRPGGNADILRKFIALDIPVITRTWTQVDEDIGHYRLVRGYTDLGFIQDDSLQGKDLFYSYDEFDQLWEKFNFEYLVLIPQDKVARARQILGEDANELVAWQKAVLSSERELLADSSNIYARFNLSVALFKVGNYQRSVAEFEKVENLLPFRTLWYQIEPIEAYFELGNYERVFEITDRILENHNRAFSEAYIIRGNIYKNQGNIEAAKAEYEKAIFYNENLDEAREALESIAA